MFGVHMDNDIPYNITILYLLHQSSIRTYFYAFAFGMSMRNDVECQWRHTGNTSSCKKPIRGRIRLLHHSEH